MIYVFLNGICAKWMQTALMGILNSVCQFHVFCWLALYHMHLFVCVCVHDYARSLLNFFVLKLQLGLVVSFLSAHLIQTLLAWAVEYAGCTSAERYLFMRLLVGHRWWTLMLQDGILVAEQFVNWQPKWSCSLQHST